MIKKNLFMSVLFASLSTYTLAANTHSMDSDKGYLDGINGNLVTYCAADETACKAVIDMFNADVAAANSSGSFEAKFVRLSTSEMLARVKGELEKSAQAVKRKWMSLFTAPTIHIKRPSKMIYFHHMTTQAQGIPIRGLLI